MKRRNIKEKVIRTMLLLNFIIFSVGKVHASTNEVVVDLPIQQIFKVEKNGSNQLKLIGTYEFTRLTRESPMPNGSNDNDVYPFTMDGKNVTKKLSITFDHEGVYQYRLFQTTKDSEKYIYDKSNYTITVYVKNGADGKLISEVIAEKVDGKKCEELSFQNCYEEKRTSNTQTQKPVQTGDNTYNDMWLMIYSGSILGIIIFVKKKYIGNREKHS